MKKSKVYALLRNANLAIGLGLSACIALAFPTIVASVGLGLAICFTASSWAYTCCFPLMCHHFCLKHRRKEQEAEVRQVEGERFVDYTAKDYVSTKQPTKTATATKTQISAKRNDVEIQR